VDYYESTLRPHAGHARVFRFWIHRTLKRAADHSDLARQLNAELHLGVDPDADLATTRQFDCGGVRGASFPAPPTVDLSTDATPTDGARRFGLNLGGGLSLAEGELSAGLSLGARLSLRSDQAVVFNPLIGLNLLYVPPVGDRTTHLAAAIAEIGLRVQQPLRGAYLDVRAGGYIGLQLPTPEPEIEGGPTGAIGLGYRWERLEVGAEARWLHDVGSSTDRFIILGVGGISF
jgi:hypothetical protein